MWFAINTEGCLRMPLRFELLLLDLAESGPQGKALQCRAGQWKAAQPEAQKLNNARLGSCSALHWMLSYVDEPDEPYVLCLSHTLLGTARIPTECPLPHLEMLWRGKKSPAPGHNGNLTFAAATQDITSPPSYLPPRVPQLCSQPLSLLLTTLKYIRYEVLGRLF